MRVDLLRIESSSEGTFGVIRLKGKAFCVTLEPPYMNNKENKSCIPTGEYFCRRIISPRYGETFTVQNVLNRSHILFHPGNVVNHTQGCILLGQHFGKLREERAVLNSGFTFKNFMREMDKINTFVLCIKNC